MSTELNALIEEHNVPGVSVAILNIDGDMTIEVAGRSSLETDSPTEPETIFEAASLSKTVFAYIVLRMAEKGEIDLDKPLVEQSIRGFGPPNLQSSKEHRELTPKMILSHQAGLPNWFKPGEDEAYLSTPGQQFSYSGLAYCFLNEVIEERSGKSLEDLAQEEFKRIDMTHSSFYQPETGSRLKLAKGHSETGETDTRSHFPKKSESSNSGAPYPANPAASLFTTAADYTRFLQTCVSDKFIRENMFCSQVNLSGKDTKAIEAGVEPAHLDRISWGLGVGLQPNEDGTLTAFHWGDCETFRNFSAVKINHGSLVSGVTVLTNSANGPSVFRQIIEPVIGDLTPTLKWLAKREQLPVSFPTTKPESTSSESTMRAALGVPLNTKPSFREDNTEDTEHKTSTPVTLDNGARVGVPASAKVEKDEEHSSPLPRSI